MKLCVISDSHLCRERLQQAVRAEEDCDAFIHLGDLAVDAEYLKRLTDRPVYAVRGNCDLGSALSAEQTLDLEGIRLLLCHGHERRVKTELYPLLLRAREIGAQIALFGHTHIPLRVQEEGVLLLNPGALKDGRYALLTLEAGSVTAELKRLLRP